MCNIPPFKEDERLPNGCYESSVSYFRKRFVMEFPLPITREFIYRHFIAFLKDFLEEVELNKVVVCGNFITKKNNPCYIDFLMIVDSSSITGENYMEIIQMNNIPMDMREERLLANNGMIYQSNQLLPSNYHYVCNFFILNKVNMEESKEDLYESYEEKKDFWKKYGPFKNKRSYSNVAAVFFEINPDNLKQILS